MVSLVIRSAIYQVVFYLNLVFWVVLGLPTYFMPRFGVVWIAQNWGRASIFWMRIVCNTKVEYRGLEKIPKGPLLVAAKHQSAWETFALLQFFEQPLYILKRELLWLPFFGWYLSKADMIGVNRGAGGRALIDVFKRARDEVRRGRQLIIFPEGTRMPVGAPPDYKSGVSQIYVTCGVTCLPVALNAGMFWPRRSFLRYPGTIVIEFLDPIAPGLPRDEFTRRVSGVIEEATARLVDDAREEQIRLLGFSSTDIRSSAAAA